MTKALKWKALKGLTRFLTKGKKKNSMKLTLQLKSV